MGIMGLLFLALLVDISLNLRRVSNDIKKMIGSYEKIHGLDKKA